MNRFTKIIYKLIPTMLHKYIFMIFMCKFPKLFSKETKWKIPMQFPHKVIKASGVKVNTFGLENIPKDRAFLLCSNHQDKCDPCLIWDTCPVPINVVVADSACHRAVIREFTTLIDAVKLEKDNLKSMLKMTEEITERLAAGESFILFPEGGYEENPYELSPFMSGSFRSALRSKVPILPVALINSFHIVKENRPLPITVEVHYLPPIYPEEFDGMKTKELSALVRDRIQACVTEFQK